MSAEDEVLEEWKFEFGLANQSVGGVSRTQADELFEVIIAWAEANGLGIGGSYRPFRDEECLPFDIPTEVD